MLHHMARKSSTSISNAPPKFQYLYYRACVGSETRSHPARQHGVCVHVARVSILSPAEQAFHSYGGFLAARTDAEVSDTSFVHSTVAILEHVMVCF